ncbi:hypothetical protein [Chlorogloea sp. CCALA 695]|nr:hypothetical protein [Chlorogloea sp. CCALA 695]
MIGSDRESHVLWATKQFLPTGFLLISAFTNPHQLGVAMVTKPG